MGYAIRSKEDGTDVRASEIFLTIFALEINQ